MRHLLFALLLFASSLVFAQPDPFGIRGNGINNAVDFVRVDQSTGAVTNISTVNGVTSVIVSGTAVNTQAGHYVFQTMSGNNSRLLALDTATGAILHDNVITEDLIGFEYSCISDKIYTLESVGGSFKLVSVDETTGNVSTIGSIPSMSAIVVGGYALNPDDYEYYALGISGNVKRLFTLSLFGGNVVNNPVITENLGGIRYNCLMDKLYAIRSGQGINGGMSLVSIDPVTGTTTQEANLPFVSSYVVESGAIHSATNTYSFIGGTGSNKRLYSIDLSSGNVSQSQAFTDNVSSLNVSNCCQGFPSVKFEADTTTIIVGDSVNFVDYTSNNPTSWTWEFTGGSPSTSTIQNPQNIQYNSTGCFPVKLTVQNSTISAFKEKLCYIQVNPIPTPPVADFAGAPGTVGTNAPVAFTDLSSGNPTSWIWSFPGGTPATAVGSNPGSVTYAAFGTYDVQLIVSNSLGTDTLLREDYINVIDTTQVMFVDFSVEPQTGFAGQPFQFTNLSTHHDNSLWTFGSVNQFHSSEPHPSNVVFTEPGCHEVTLQITGGPGTETLTRSCFVEITEASTGVEDELAEAGFKLFPNPATGQSELAFERVMEQPAALVYDLTGREVRSISSRNTQQLSIPLDNLKSGIYLVVVSDQGMRIGTQKLVVR